MTDYADVRGLNRATSGAGREAARAAAPRRRMSDSRSGHLEIRIDRRRVSSASVILQSAKSA
jgi:hypothetical protein